MLTETDIAALNDQACENNLGRQGEWDELNEDGKAWARELARLAYERGRAETAIDDSEPLVTKTEVLKGFRCPKCGSSYFRTISGVTGPMSTRQCKGHAVGAREYSGCDYTWTSNHDNAHGLWNHETPQEPMGSKEIEPQGAPPPVVYDCKGEGHTGCGVCYACTKGAPQKPEGA